MSKPTHPIDFEKALSCPVITSVADKLLDQTTSNDIPYNWSKVMMNILDKKIILQQIGQHWAIDEFAALQASYHSTLNILL